MEFYFSVTAQLVLDHEPGAKHSRHISTNFNLEPGPNLDDSKYIEGDDLLPDGCKVVTDTLVSAIISNVHYAHEKGFIDSAQHLREIIRKMEEHFITVPNIKRGYLK